MNRRNFLQLLPAALVIPVALKSVIDEPILYVFGDSKPTVEGFSPEGFSPINPIKYREYKKLEGNFSPLVEGVLPTYSGRGRFIE